MTEFAVHDPPQDADFLIQVPLEEHGMPGRSEQLWVKRVAPLRFLVRSIPFFPYGIRPGDEVETDESFRFSRVVERSGKEVLRVAAPAGSDASLEASLHPLLEQWQLPHEWHNEGYVAIELDQPELPVPLALHLEHEHRRGLVEFELA